MEITAQRAREELVFAIKVAEVGAEVRGETDPDDLGARATGGNYPQRL